MKYSDLQFKDRAGRGISARHTFPNGYGVSIITDGYGSDEGLLELAVLHNDRLCYSTPITDDVLGYLTPADVERIMGEVEALPARNNVE